MREDEIKAPALDPDIIGEMIQAIKENGAPDEKAFLSISTTYAMRKIEMIELTHDDVKLKGRTIHIATAKHGRERTHLIPEEIVPHLKGYDFDTKISGFGLNTLWYRLEYRIGLKHIDGVGFHNIRQTLNTMLFDHLPKNTVMSFLRKKGLTIKVVGEAKDVDSEVFKVHPFLHYWR